MLAGPQDRVAVARLYAAAPDAGLHQPSASQRDHLFRRATEEMMSSQPPRGAPRHATGWHRTRRRATAHHRARRHAIVNRSLRGGDALPVRLTASGAAKLKRHKTSLAVDMRWRNESPGSPVALALHLNRQRARSVVSRVSALSLFARATTLHKFSCCAAKLRTRARRFDTNCAGE